MELLRKVYEYTLKDIGPIYEGGTATPTVEEFKRLISTMPFGTTSSEVDVNWTSLVGTYVCVCVCVCVYVCVCVCVCACLGVTCDILPIIQLANISIQIMANTNNQSDVYISPNFYTFHAMHQLQPNSTLIL